MRSSVFAAAVVFTLGAMMIGCEGPRSLERVKESGDRALARGYYNRAATEYAEYVERYPGDAPVHNAYAKTLLELDRPREAREQAWQAYSIRPVSDEYFETLAASLYAAGDSEELYRLLRQRTLDRGRLEDYYRLSRYARLMGDVDEAERALLTAARLDRGQSAEPQLRLSEFYESIGDSRRALQRLRMAYQVTDDPTALEERIRAYNEIPGPTFGVVPTERGE